LCTRYGIYLWNMTLLGLFPTTVCVELGFLVWNQVPVLGVINSCAAGNQWGDPRAVWKVRATITQWFSRTTTFTTATFYCTKLYTWHSVDITRGKNLSGKANLLETKEENCQKQRENSDRGIYLVMTRKGRWRSPSKRGEQYWLFYRGCSGS
jgi:hypothetical protein